PKISPSCTSNVMPLMVSSPEAGYLKCRSLTLKTVPMALPLSFDLPVIPAAPAVVGRWLLPGYPVLYDIYDLEGCFKQVFGISAGNQLVDVGKKDFYQFDNEPWRVTAVDLSGLNGLVNPFAGGFVVVESKEAEEPVSESIIFFHQHVGYTVHPFVGHHEFRGCPHHFLEHAEKVIGAEVFLHKRIEEGELFLHQYVHHGQVKRELVAEVMIEAAFAHAGLPEDIIEGCICVSPGGKFVDGCFFQFGIAQQRVIISN